MATLWLRCRHLVIDPCNRMPGHLPRSDGWLNSQNDRLAVFRQINLRVVTS